MSQEAPATNDLNPYTDWNRLLFLSHQLYVIGDDQEMQTEVDEILTKLSED